MSYRHVSMGVVLIVLGALMLGSGARSVAAAACDSSDARAPTDLIRTKTISNTLQPEANMFVCRVDGAGTLASDTTSATRSVTFIGLVLLVAARWLHFVGFALAFGTIMLSVWLASTLGDRQRWMPHLWRLVYSGIVVLLCAEPLALLAQTVGVGGTFFDLDVAGTVLASGFGLVWAQRVGVALLLWVIVGVVKDGSERALWSVPFLGLALATIDGAAGAAGTALPMAAIAAAVLHELAMGVWIGGLALVLALWLAPERGHYPAVWERFAYLSVAAIGVLAFSGLIMSVLRLTQFADLFATSYGALLLVKLLVSLIAIALALAGQRFRLFWPWRATLATLLVVLGVASLLVSVPVP